MHHYRFHIGDYISHTTHLTNAEDITYRRLMDLYYLREGWLPLDFADCAKLIRIDDVALVERVVREFFSHAVKPPQPHGGIQVEGWMSKRCDAEIAHYRAWMDKSQKGGRASAEARKKLNHPSTATVPHTTTTTTTTTNKEEEKRAQAPKPRFARPALEEVKAYCMERKNTIDAQKFIDYYDSKGWLIGRAPMKDWKAAIRTWERTSLTSQPSQSNPRGGPTQGPNAPRPCLSCGSTTRGGYWAPDGWRCHDHRHED